MRDWFIFPAWILLIRAVPMMAQDEARLLPLSPRVDVALRAEDRAYFHILPGYTRFASAKIVSRRGLRFDVYRAGSPLPDSLPLTGQCAMLLADFIDRYELILGSVNGQEMDSSIALPLPERGSPRV